MAENKKIDNRRILIIDDDTRIHSDFRKILCARNEESELDQLESSLFDNVPQAAGNISYELDSAYQGEEGFKKVVAAMNNNNPYAMAFVDMRMPPGWDGLETIQHIWNIDTKIQLVICTAYSDYSWNEVLYHLGASDRLIILKKPFDMVEVQQIATALTTKWNLSEESLYRLQQIKESEEKYRTVVDSVEDSIMTLDPDGNILFANHNPWHLIDQAVGNNYYSGVKDEFKNELKSLVNDVIKTGKQVRVEYARGDNKNTIWSEGRISPYYKNDEVVAATLVASDISARKALDWQLRHDELTGLPNRAYFTSYLEEKIIAPDDVLGSGYILMFIDLDRFNLINECFGHEIGDKLLVRVAHSINSELNELDMLARFGGDEFAILKHCSNSLDEAKNCAEKLKELVKVPVEIDGFAIYPSASIGIVLIDKSYDSAAGLLRDADTALYHAKGKGRNRYEYFDKSMHDSVVERVNIGNELRQAIENDEFVVYYQPFNKLENNTVTGFEALVRWQHPQRGLVMPLDFIPIAEETGLIFSITKIILHKVCVQNRLWRDKGLKNIKVAVNCSAREFYEQDLKSIIWDIIQETGAEIKALELELTESSIMDDVELAIKNLHELHEMGLNISIDDFGTGYSSFGYIKRFPIHKLKIDREFIRGLPEDEDDLAIVEAIMAMAQRLNIRVVCEGVETTGQLDYLRKINCDVVQGYLLGRPMQADEVTRRLLENDWDINKL